MTMPEERARNTLLVPEFLEALRGDAKAMLRFGFTRRPPREVAERAAALARHLASTAELRRALELLDAFERAHQPDSPGYERAPSSPAVLVRADLWHRHETGCIAQPKGRKRTP